MANPSLNEFAPNYVIGCEIQKVEDSNQKMLFYFDEEGRMHIVLFDKEEKAVDFDFSLLEAAKMAYVLQGMVAEYIDMVAEEEEEEGELN